MPDRVRNATPEDAAFLVRIIDLASEGLVPAIWEEMAPEGMDGATVGQSLVSAAEGDFSYLNGLIIERGGAPVGGMISYRLPMEFGPSDPDLPDVFRSIEELGTHAPGYWYINVVAVAQEVRGNGLGAALLEAAEARARKSGCPGLALVVAASNAGAIRAYQRAGYKERERRPFDLSEFGAESTEALLMMKDFY